MKSSFYFIYEAFFILKIFKFLYFPLALFFPCQLKVTFKLLKIQVISNFITSSFGETRIC